MNDSWHYQFSHPVIFRVKGKDAERYLHSRFSARIKGMSYGTHVSAAALTAQGRVEIYGTIIRQGEQEFLLISDGGERETLESALRRYIVADRVDVENISDDYTFYHVDDVKSAFLKAEDTAPASVASLDTSLVWRHQRSSPFGVDILVPKDSILSSSLPPFCRSEDEFSYACLLFGTPSFPKEVSEQTLPFEVGIRHAVAFNKGCYIGKEVMEKMDAYGRVPRLAWVGEIEGHPEIDKGESVMMEGADASSLMSVGKVLSLARGEHSTLVCALIKSSIDDARPLILQEKYRIITRWPLQGKA